jgi:hypothetical protein
MRGASRLGWVLIVLAVYVGLLAGARRGGLGGESTAPWWSLPLAGLAHAALAVALSLHAGLGWLRATLALWTAHAGLAGLGALVIVALEPSGWLAALEQGLLGLPLSPGAQAAGAALMMLSPGRSGDAEAAGAGSNGSGAPAGPGRAAPVRPGGEVLRVSFERVVGQLPAVAFTVAPETLGDQLAVPGQLLVPREAVLSSLGQGYAVVDWALVAEQFPAGLFAVPKAAVGEAMPRGKLLLPIDEIVAQLPVELFTRSLAPVDLSGLDDFPAPFPDGEGEERPAAPSVGVDLAPHEMPAAPAVPTAPESFPAAEDPLPAPTPPAVLTASLADRAGVDTPLAPAPPPLPGVAPPPATPAGAPGSGPLGTDEHDALAVALGAPGEAPSSSTGPEEAAGPEPGPAIVAPPAADARSEVRALAAALLAPPASGPALVDSHRAGGVPVHVLADAATPAAALAAVAAAVVPLLDPRRCPWRLAQVSLAGDGPTVTFTPLGDPSRGEPVLLTAAPPRRAVLLALRARRLAAARPAGPPEPGFDPALLGALDPDGDRDLSGAAAALAPAGGLEARSLRDGELDVHCFAPRGLPAGLLGAFAVALVRALDEAERAAGGLRFRTATLQGSGLRALVERLPGRAGRPGVVVAAGLDAAPGRARRAMARATSVLAGAEG